MPSLPYFDVLLEGRRRGLPSARAFDRFVHWGYWDDPRLATGDATDLAVAMDRLNALLLSVAELANGQVVLDCGCGFGGTLTTVGERWRAMSLVGVNIDPRQLAVATARASAGTNAIAFLAADACSLPFADASFDRVLAVECVFHFPSRQRFLHEAARVLRPGGCLVLSDFVPSWIPLGRLSAARWLERQIATGYGPTGGRWSEGSYLKMAGAAGLEVEVDRDITRHTLPTYDALLGLIARDGMAAPREGALMDWPTRLLAAISRLGLLRYRLLRISKPPSVPSQRRLRASALVVQRIRADSEPSHADRGTPVYSAPRLSTREN